MILTKIRIQEDHPMIVGSTPVALPSVDLYLNSYNGDSGYLIKNSTGLGPPVLASVVEGFDTSGLPIFNSVATNGREIALRVGLTPYTGQTVNQLRDELYKFIARSVRVSLMDDALIIAQTTGFIKHIDVTHFSNQPEVQVIISSEYGEFWAPASLPVPADQIGITGGVIDYSEGTAPTGIEFEFEVSATRANWKFFNYAKLWYSGTTPPTNEFKVTYPFVSGDVVSVNTQVKQRKINLLRSGINYDLAGYLNPGSVWPKLYPGVNNFSWDVDYSWAEFNVFKYTPRYWGI